MSAHTLQMRAGRYQCTKCRAAWKEKDGAHGATPCLAVPLPHGPVGKRDHLVYPTWSRQSCKEVECDLPSCDGVHGPDEYCDDVSCPCQLHVCSCDVCEMRESAPGLNVLRDSHEGDDEKLSRFSLAATG